MGGLSNKVRAAILLASLDDELVAGMKELLQDEVNGDSFVHGFEEIPLADLSNRLLTLPDNEIALVVSVLAPFRASQLFKLMPTDRQSSIVKEILSHSDPEFESDIFNAIANKIGLTGSQLVVGTIGGIDVAVNVLSALDPIVSKQVLDTLDNDLSVAVRSRLFYFEDFIYVNDKGIQQTLKGVDHGDLALALKTASEELKAKFFNNMSARASELVLEDMEYLGSVKLYDVEESQQAMCKILLSLLETGDAILSGKDTGNGPIVE